MNTYLHINRSVKKLVISAALTTALVAIPGVSMADKADHGNKHGTFTTINSKHHGDGHRISNRDNLNHRDNGRHHQEPRHKHRDRHEHRYGHDRDWHNHTHYVVNEYYYDDHELDRLWFMIGLHTDNVDVILHE